MKRSPRVVSVIDIGSSFVRMGVYQPGRDGVETLDMLEYPTRIGHEAFTEGRIRADTLRELTGALRGYSQVMKEYGVNEYRAVATTALREAENRPYVIDQLKTQNGLVVSVLEDGEESALIYAEMLRSPLLKKNTMLAYIGTGSVGVAEASDHAVSRVCSIRLGFLKLGEILRELEDQTTHFHTVVEEYVETYFRRLNRPFGRAGLDSLMLTGRELETIAPLCGAALEQGAYRLERAQLDELYRRIKTMGVAAIAGQYGLTEEVAAQLLPMIAIYRKIMGLTKAERIVAPRLDLMDILAAQLLIPARRRDFETAQRDGALRCAGRLAETRHADLAHARRVSDWAVLLFEKLKKLHGVSGKRRILLECAALLHETGESINGKSTADAAYNLIRQTYLYGMSEEETLLTAEIARYANWHEGIDAPRENLPEKQRLLVDKLAAILMLANALDESHRGKVAELKLKLDEKQLVVTARAVPGSGGADLLLEKWAFGECAPFFEEVFGVQPVFVGKTALPK